jgi:predicted RND superfamily exporter protein
VATRIDAVFLAWSRILVAHPWVVIVASLLVVGAVGSQIRHVTLDFTPESFLSPGHPEREQYNDFRRQFGTDNIVVVAIRPSDPWSPEFLTWLRGLHETLESEVPFVNDVTSLINARVTRGDADSLIVEDLMEEWPETPARA